MTPAQGWYSPPKHGSHGSSSHNEKVCIAGIVLLPPFCHSSGALWSQVFRQCAWWSLSTRWLALRCLWQSWTRTSWSRPSKGNGSSWASPPRVWQLSWKLSSQQFKEWAFCFRDLQQHRLLPEPGLLCLRGLEHRMVLSMPCWLVASFTSPKLLFAEAQLFGRGGWRPGFSSCSGNNVAELLDGSQGSFEREPLETCGTWRTRVANCERETEEINCGNGTKRNVPKNHQPYRGYNLRCSFSRANIDTDLNYVRFNSFKF